MCYLSDSGYRYVARFIISVVLFISSATGISERIRYLNMCIGFHEVARAVVHRLCRNPSDWETFDIGSLAGLALFEFQVSLASTRIHYVPLCAHWKEYDVGEEDINERRLG